MEPNNRENGTHNLQNLIGEIPLENNFSKFQNENHAKETKLSNSRRFSQREMESLSAICDTYLPSIEMPLENNTTVDESTKEFYQTSASMVGTPYHMEWLIKERLQHPKLFLSKLSFLLLSTWIGTFILCGRRSLSNHFPYFQKFSQIPQKRREEILLSWSQSYFSLLRILFLGTKYLTLLSFFTQISS
ncbi:oxidase [Lithospermum erythrorhizon]|uniref:Oxidase n=1 Tax=Lithospermum erythrorhizon TaxID=34254 RepID=A0AAV3RCV5_LITER